MEAQKVTCPRIPALVCMSPPHILYCTPYCFSVKAPQGAPGGPGPCHWVEGDPSPLHPEDKGELEGTAWGQNVLPQLSLVLLCCPFAQPGPVIFL